MPGFVDQVITEHTSLNTSHYKMLGDIARTKTSKNKRFPLSSRLVLSEGKGKIHQHYMNPLFVSSEVGIESVKSVSRTTCTEFLLKAVTSQGQGPSFHHLHVLRTTRAPAQRTFLFYINGMPSHH